MVEVVAKSSRTATTPNISIASYLRNRKGNSGKSARNAALSQGREDNLKKNLKFGSWLTRGRKISAPSKSSRKISEKAMMGVIRNMKNLRKR